MQLFSAVRSFLVQKPILIGFFVVLLCFTLVFAHKSTVTETVPEPKLPVVSLLSAREYAGDQSLSVVGTVRPFSEASITTERAGRVVSVPVRLGAVVQAGAVIATLENATEQAAVLQAEGVYEAALAGAAQSTVGVAEANTQLNKAKENAVSVFKSAYNTTNGTVRNNIDSFFTDPDARTPGLRIQGKGYTSDLNDRRVALQRDLVLWQTAVKSISLTDDLQAKLSYTDQQIQAVITMLDIFLTVFSKQDNNSSYTDTELVSFTTSFTASRATLLALQSSVKAAQTELQTKTDALEKATIAASGNTVSIADGQVKQALGTLRAAQANLAKTILRAPVSGTINSLSVKAGDFVSLYQQVAEVANNNALEVVTYVSDKERDRISVGDSVLVDTTIPGTITDIAPAVDKVTRKTEVRIAVEGAKLVSGDTVRIEKQLTDKTSADLVTIRVPLTAVKFARENGQLLLVTDTTLEARPVTLGAILGESVEVVDGLARDEYFVADVRGLVAGERVEIAN